MWLALEVFPPHYEYAFNAVLLLMTSFSLETEMRDSPE